MIFVSYILGNDSLSNPSRIRTQQISMTFRFIIGL